MIPIHAHKSNSARSNVLSDDGAEIDRGCWCFRERQPKDRRSPVDRPIDSRAEQINSIEGGG
jgi:hypothetical protein